jgi:DNA-directed RNA polymerase specialized sigma24 family protein
MRDASPITATDRECLVTFARTHDTEALRPVITRYLEFVYASAFRRIGDTILAADVTRAVFLVFARRAHKLRKKIVLAAWLFQITSITCRKLKVPTLKRVIGSPPAQVLDDAALWSRIAPELDRALEKLSAIQRDAALLCLFLNYDFDSAARILRTRARRVKRRVELGLGKLVKRLRKTVAVPDVCTLKRLCAAANGATTSLSNEFAPRPGDVPPPLPMEAGSVSPASISLRELSFDIFKTIAESRGRRPTMPLARRTLSTLAWRRWRRRVMIGLPVFILFLLATVATAWAIDARTGHSRLISALLVWSSRHESKRVPGLAQPAKTWPANADMPRLSAAALRNARDLYQTTNIWQAHLTFSRGQWKALEPNRIGALPNFLQPDGTALLRNPRAQRSGLAGVLGFDFNWTHADFDFGGVAFTNVAARIKGNGTYLASLSGDKRAFKVDLNKFAKSQKLAGLDELTFNNLSCDHSFMSDTLAYEFFWDAGVPAPRTAYAWLTVSVAGQWQHKPLGLYVMVEPVDAAFVAARFSEKTAVFKPVTYQLFEHLGDDWKSYAAIYDPKTKATDENKQRVIDFARLVSFADDAEFARRVGRFLDLDEFARFLAGEVLLSSYDGILSDGQNFYVYLDARSNKFGFIPWDLDLAWGSFFLLGSITERERASIWHPWVGQNRFIERVMAAEEFRRIYRAHLEDFSTRLFVPTRLNKRIDELAAIIRSPVAAESDFRLDKFEQAVGAKPLSASHGEPHGADRPAHQLKRFIEKRALSVRDQLDGKSKGMILKRNGPG